jgi:hypothetical protein
MKETPSTRAKGPLPDIPPDAPRMSSGAYGFVLRVSDDVVAKIIPDTHPEAIELEAAMAQRAHRLCPDTIVLVLGVRQTQHGWAIYMENLQGWPTSGHWVQTAQPDRETLAGVGRALVSTLTTLHSHGIFHRDLKPDNIVIHPTTLRPKILDFGLTCVFPQCRQSIVGYPVYMHPELLQRFSLDREGRWMVNITGLTPEMSHTHDMWSLGMTLVALLHGGVHPFLPEFDTLAAVMALYTNSLTRPAVVKILGSWNTELQRLLGGQVLLLKQRGA